MAKCPSCDDVIAQIETDEMVVPGADTTAYVCPDCDAVLGIGKVNF
jgi:ssDNA-binding Zn-finger/Zn-ribbon topoisomerase 1